MKFTNRITIAVLAAGLCLPAATLLAEGPAAGYGQGYGQGDGRGYEQGGWDAPPSDFRRDLQRNAFRDGLEGARRDAENRRRPNVLNRDEYRNYRGPDRRAYRQAFARGYQVFWQHQGGPGPRPY